MKLSVYDMPATFVPQSFIDRVAAAGGAPVLLPPLPGVEQLVELLDGIVLIPGPDVDPALYSASTSHPQTRANARRDSIELVVLDAALSVELPLLGICRGLQVLNTLQGGSLHQHLPEIVHHEEHSPGDVTFGQQLVRLEPGSLIAKAVQSDSTLVSCHHHQAIDRLGRGLDVTGRAADGTIEAVELADHPFAVAVQWHAEQGEDVSLFTAFIEAAGHYRRKRRT